MTFIHGYPQEVQTFPFLSTYLHIWGHSCPTAYISENSCNSWHHSWALHGRKSLKQQPAPKREITTVYAQLNCELTTREPDSPKSLQMLMLMHVLGEKGGKKKLTLGIRACVCARHGVQTGSEPGSQQIHRLYQRRQDGIHSIYHPSPAGDMMRGRREAHNQGEDQNYRCVRIIQNSPHRGS